MNNVLKVARKEFADLSGSWLVVVILFVYAISIVSTVYDFYSVVLVQHGESGERLLNISLGGVWYVLTYYGMFVGVVIGFSSIASERYGNALNTLVAKPLFRDSIINGKLVGAFCFLLCIFALAIAFFTAALFIVCGYSFVSVFPGFVSVIPLLFVLSVFYVMIYLALAMLVSLIVKNQALALIIVFLLVYMFDIARTMNLAGALSMIFSDPGLGSTIVGLSPMGLSDKIQMVLFPPSLPAGLSDSVYSQIPKYTIDLSLIEQPVFNIVLYVVVLVVTSYIVFMRRDLS